ncbi:hypothetical protein Trydic_g6718 [Trypoxylus dichotomus]
MFAGSSRRVLRQVLEGGVMAEYKERQNKNDVWQHDLIAVDLRIGVEQPEEGKDGKENSETKGHLGLEMTISICEIIDTGL